MPIDRDVLDAVKEMDAHDLRRLQILTRAHLERSGMAPEVSQPNISMRSQMVRCGKPECRTCPHGPYWYAYWTENGKRRSRYVGRLPEDGSLS